MNPNMTQRDYANHRRFAVMFFNETWALMDKTDRTPADDARMVHLAHASRMHWECIGTPSNKAVGDWQISRVYGILGIIQPALYYARSAVDILTAADIQGFYLGSAHEGLARALRLAGESEAEKHVEAAKAILNSLSDPDERSVLESDLASLPPSKRASFAPSLSSSDDLVWQTFGVERIVALKNATPLWRILTTDLNSFSCDVPNVIAVLQSSVSERRAVKVGIARSDENRDWIVSAVLTGDPIVPVETPIDTSEHTPSALLF